MKVKYNSETQTLRLQDPEGWRQTEKCVAEVRFGDNIFYVQVYNHDIRERLDLLHSKDSDPETNQEVAFLLKYLRQQRPLAVIVGRRIETDQKAADHLWLRDLKELDQARAQKIRERLETGNGLLQEYLC